MVMAAIAAAGVSHEQITGKANHATEERWPHLRRHRGRRDARRRRDERSQRAIEAPLRLKSAAPARGELEMRAVDRQRSVEHFLHDRRGELRARQREAQAIAGHRIDEAGRVTRQEQSRLARRRRIHGHRTEHCRRRDRARVGEARGQFRIRLEISIERFAPAARAADRHRSPVPPKRPREGGCGTTTQALVSPPGTGATPM